MGGVFLVALGIRLLYFTAFQGTPFAEVLLVDARWHDEWALAWAEGRWDMGGVAFFRAPLYPYWLSLLYQIFGHDYTAIRLFQIALGSATAAAMAGTFTRLWGARYGLWSGMLIAFYGPFIYFDHEFLIPNVLLFLLAWAIFLTSLRPKFWVWTLAGLLLGLAVVARPNVLVILPVFLWFLWVGARTWRPHIRRLAGTSFLLTALLPALVVTALNYHAEGIPVAVASQGGINFYGGNNALASGRSIEVPEFSNMVNWREFVPQMQAIAQDRAGQSLNSMEISNYWTREGFRWISENPIDALTLYAKKTYYLIAGYEIANNRSLYFQAPWPLKVLLWDTSVFSFPAGIIFPMAVVGFVLLLGNPKFRPGALFLLGVAVCYSLSLLPFFLCARFRLPVVLILLGPASYAFVHWREVVRPRTLTLLILLGILVNAGFFEARRNTPSTDLTKLGAALFEQGDPRGAADVLEEARRNNPGNLGAVFWLAHVYSRLGNIQGAIPLYENLVEARPQDAALWFQLGTSRFEIRDYSGSLVPLQNAARLVSSNFRYQVNLGAAQEANDLVAEAAESYQKAIVLQPDHDLAYLRLSELLTRMKPNSEEAKDAQEAMQRRLWEKQ